MTVGLAIFDSDGVLVDSEGLAADAMAAMATSPGLPMSSADARVAFRGGRTQDCVEAISARLGRELPQAFTCDDRALLASALRTHLQPMPGARELPASLRVPFCVASSGAREQIERSPGVTGLLEHVSAHLFGGYEVGHSRSDPQWLLHAARTIGVAPGQCLVVEGSAPGLCAGIAAGMQGVALLTEGADPRFAARIDVISTVSVLPELFDRRHQRVTA
ncbi:MAG: HAD-IA family hydrolase [Dokdonella sp.]